MSTTPGTIVEQGGNLYRVDQETYTYYDTVVTTQTKTDFTGFDDVAICRPKILYFKVIGLRPNTRHFVYFDRIDVSNFINTNISNVEEFRSLPRNDSKRNPGEKYITATGFPAELGGPTSPILSDAAGTIEGIFYLQSNASLSFPTGKRTMSFIDINILDPSRALSYASTTFTVDGGIESYATNYYTSSQQVAMTGVRNNLTFIAPVITEAVVNNITNEYVTNVTNEYVTINNITQTVTVDPETGGSGGEEVTDGGDTDTPTDNGAGNNNNSNTNNTIPQDDDRGPDRGNTQPSVGIGPAQPGQGPAQGGYYNGGEGGGGGGSSKIICTAMNNAYGFGSFRQKIWLQQSMGLRKEYEIGYHAIALPLIDYAYRTNKIGHTVVRSFLEHCARRRTADIWKQKRGKRDLIGAVERSIIEPICFMTGWVILKSKNRKQQGL